MAAGLAQANQYELFLTFQPLWNGIDCKQQPTTFTKHNSIGPVKGS